MRCQVITKMNEFSSGFYWLKTLGEKGQKLETGKIVEMDLTEVQIQEMREFCGGKYIVVNPLPENFKAETPSVDVSPAAPAPTTPAHKRK